MRLRVFGRWLGYSAAAIGIVGGLFTLGYWSKGLTVDIDKRTLLQEIQSLSSIKNKLDARVNVLQEENDNLRADVARVGKTAADISQLKEYLSKTEAERATLEKENSALTAENKELAINLGQLSKQVDQSEMRRVLLSRLETLERERKDLERAVWNKLEQAKSWRSSVAADRERCRILKAQGESPAMVEFCTRAAAMAEEADGIEKEIQWLQNRTRVIEEEMARVQAKL